MANESVERVRQSLVYVIEKEDVILVDTNIITKGDNYPEDGDSYFSDNRMNCVKFFCELIQRYGHISTVRGVLKERRAALRKLKKSNIKDSTSRRLYGKINILDRYVEKFDEISGIFKNRILDFDNLKEVIKFIQENNVYLSREGKSKDSYVDAELVAMALCILDQDCKGIGIISNDWDVENVLRKSIRTIKRNPEREIVEKLDYGFISYYNLLRNGTYEKRFNSSQSDGFGTLVGGKKVEVLDAISEGIFH